MSNIAGEEKWEDNVYQFEETDVVAGGPDGVDNLPLKQLANRTAWLKRSLGCTPITIVSASKTLTKEDVFFKRVVIYANFASIELSLPTLEPEDIGLHISVVAYSVSKQVALKSGSEIIFGSSSKYNLYMGDGDSLDLVWLGTRWLVERSTGNFLDTGLIQYGYSVRPNTVIAKGDLLLRSDYPRLWEYVQTIGASLINDSTWNNVPGNKGFFSAGNGLTTFRIPDLRSMFIRGLDLGAGITYGRYSENAGGYEPDDFKSHKHGPSSPMGKGDGLAKSGGQAVSRVWNDKEGDYQNNLTDSQGGTETRPKNIGLMPLIKV